MYPRHRHFTAEPLVGAAIEFKMTGYFSRELMVEAAGED
jgi:hypothetical protein